MKKKIIVIVVIILVLAVLIVPFKSDTANDGGTRVYSALTYKAVKWNKLYDKSATGSNPEFYKNTAVYFFPDSFKDIDLLWEKESKKFYKECFGNVGVGRNKNLEIVKIESDIEGITVELKSYDLKAEKPYIELIWKNSRDEEYCFGEYFDILYSEDVYSKEPLVVRRYDIAEPQLWYPLGYGEHPLYTLCVTVGDNVYTSTFGIRTLKILQLPDKEGSEYDKLCREMKKDVIGQMMDQNESFSGFQIIVNGIGPFINFFGYPISISSSISVSRSSSTLLSMIFTTAWITSRRL